MTTVNTSNTSSSPSLWRNPEKLLDLRTFVGAGIAVLFMRILFGLFALPITAIFPHTIVEQTISLIPGDAPLDRWLQRVIVAPWVRYDASNYMRIVDHGYVLSEGTAAFHPLYALISWPVAQILGRNIPLGLLVVSTFATIILLMLLSRYVEHFHDPKYAQTSGWLMLMNPVGFILLSPYNESTFLCLAVATLWALRIERWWLAGVFGALATLTRQQGLALALPIAWAIWSAWRQKRTPLWNFLAIGMVPFGYGLFVAYRAFWLGDMANISQATNLFDFLRRFLVSSSSEVVVRGQYVAWPWEPFIAQIRVIFGPRGDYTHVIDMVLGWAAVSVIIFKWRSMHSQELWYCIGISILTLCYYNGDMSPYLSFPRHMLLAFPILIALVKSFNNPTRLRYFIEIMLLGNFFLGGAFIRHGWVP
jgi:hypothetical protein